MFPKCYNTEYSPDLSKVGARLAEAREFILSYDPKQSKEENAQNAFQNRWYGNASKDVCERLTRHFIARFDRSPGQMILLRRFLSSAETTYFPVINNYYMVLGDRYYRWAASEYVAGQYHEHRLDISGDAFEAAVRKQVPTDIELGTTVRYSRNLLTALRDNGLLTGKVNKKIASPAISVNTLAYMVYALSDNGVGANEFDGSPVYLSLLKPRELFVPLFQDGERLGYWEFTGDRKRLTANLSLKGLNEWMEAASL